MILKRKEPDRRRKAHFHLLLLSILLLLTAIFILPVFSQDARAAQITLAWNANSEPTVTGYKVYYGRASRAYSAVIDVGNWTSCIVSGLQDGITYFFTATAYNAEGDESSYAAEVSYTVPAGSSPSSDPSPASPSSGGGGGGGCFIATAAYGSHMATEVTVLRKFRDEALLTNTPGRMLVGLYYRLSPPIADFIRNREYLKTLTRWALTPVVYGIKHYGASALGLPVLLAAMCLIARIGVRRFTGKKHPHPVHPGIVIVFALGLALQLFSGEAYAAQVTLAWNANTDSDLQAYKVYSGTASRTYSCNTNVGKSTTCTISDLTAGRTYYFSVTALDTAGNESGYSNEVSYRVPTPEPTPTPEPATEPTPGPIQELIISAKPYTAWNLGYSSTRKLYAQSFKAIGSRLESVTVALAKYRSPNMPVKVSIRTSPGGSTLASGQILPSQVTSKEHRNPGWIKVAFSSPVSVKKGTTYYLVIEVSTSSYSNYYRVPLGKNTYADGMAYQSAATQRSDVDILSKIVFTY